MAAALTVARRVREGVIVTVFPDGGGNIWAPTSSGESQVNRITPQDLKARLDRRDPVVLLDVRQDDEITSSWIGQARGPESPTPENRAERRGGSP
jgi:hypothetical protein